jgi:hypothetical protein
MTRNAAFVRFIALPACIVWGVLEFIALQRAHLLHKRPHF